MWIKLILMDIVTWVGLTIGIYFLLCKFVDFLYGDPDYEQYYKNHRNDD